MFKSSRSLGYRPEIVWNGYVEIGLGNTVSGSMNSIGSVSDGRLAMPTMSKSQTTTRKRSGKGPAQRRLPTMRPPTHPGEMLLEEFLKPLGISQSAFARQLDVSFPRLNEIINAKRSVTTDTALRLARVTRMSAEFWLGLQQDWDLWHALRSDEAEEIAKLEPLR